MKIIRNLKQASPLFSKIAKSLDFDDDNGPVDHIIEFRPPFKDSCRRKSFCITSD